MSRFGADPRQFFEAVYRDAAPWDIGERQPAMASLLADYPRVLTIRSAEFLSRLAPVPAILACIERVDM